MGTSSSLRIKKATRTLCVWVLKGLLEAYAFGSAYKPKKVTNSTAAVACQKVTCNTFVPDTTSGSSRYMASLISLWPGFAGYSLAVRPLTTKSNCTVCGLTLC